MLPSQGLRDATLYLGLRLSLCLRLSFRPRHRTTSHCKMILGASSSLQEKMSEAACAQAADTESNGYFTAKKSLSLLTLLRRYKSFLENSPETYFCTYKDLASSWQALGKPRQAGVFSRQARVSGNPNVCVFTQTCAQESRPSTLL